MLGFLCGAIFRSNLAPGFGLALLGSIVMSFVYVGAPHPVWIATDMLGVLISYPIGALVGWLVIKWWHRRDARALRKFKRDDPAGYAKLKAAIKADFDGT
jgi:uncharacterized membrane protein YccC